MSDLAPCKHCGGSSVSVVQVWWESGNAPRIYAARCDRCGARGPLSVAVGTMDDEQVMAKAADEWNGAIATDEGAIADAKENTSESPATELEPGQLTAQNGPASSEPAASAQAPEPPAVEGGEGTHQRITEHQAQLAERLQAFLDARELSASSAAKMYGKLIGASDPTLYKILNGKYRVSDLALDSVTSALDKLEKKTIQPPEPEPESSSASVEKLPNKFAPITGLNPLPKLAPPPRCSKVM